MHVDLIRRHGLIPHPEGGHYRETFRLPVGPDGRSVMTAILFLLAEGERSHWHRLDASELWLWHAGASLTLRIESESEIHLGDQIGEGQQLQALVPERKWQAAAAESGWVLVSCVVAPGFEFKGFELALPEWAPSTALAHQNMESIG
ncbi:cupin domain-containing protein [Mesorhizobium sp. SB112]|uniref:cupin domain-containing protein n=1 Tax=Mesorhizobium sp. SB112 TaxID=3151853 RepID=UPI003267C065